MKQSEVLEKQGQLLKEIDSLVNKSSKNKQTNK